MTEKELKQYCKDAGKKIITQDETIRKLQSQVDEVKEEIKTDLDKTDGYDLDSDYMSVGDFKQYITNILSKLKEVRK